MEARRTTVYLKERTSKLIALNNINLSELIKIAVEAKANCPQESELNKIEALIEVTENNIEQQKIKLKVLKFDLDNKKKELDKKKPKIEWVRRDY